MGGAYRAGGQRSNPQLRGGRPWRHPQSLCGPISSILAFLTVYYSVFVQQSPALHIWLFALCACPVQKSFYLGSKQRQGSTEVWEIQPPLFLSLYFETSNFELSHYHNFLPLKTHFISFGKIHYRNIIKCIIFIPFFFLLPAAIVYLLKKTQFKIIMYANEQ